MTDRSNEHRIITKTEPLFPLPRRDNLTWEEAPAVIEQQRARLETVDDSEREVVFVWTVKLRSYGKPSKVKVEQAKALGAALYREFKDRYEMSVLGQRVMFDPLAHDGEHLEHNEELSFVPEGS